MSALPAAYADLQPLADRWARPTENERNHIRWGATAGEFAAFHAAMMPRLADILALLAGYPPDAMPPDVHALFLLACAFAEAAPHHELYGGSPQVPYSFDAGRFVALHGHLHA